MTSNLFSANSVYMTDMPPPYPGINAPYQGYASGANSQQQGAWGSRPEWIPPEQNGTPGWANPNYNNQPISQTGVYTNYGQPNYFAQNPPPYSTYPQSTPFGQPGYSQHAPYN